MLRDASADGPRSFRIPVPEAGYTGFAVWDVVGGRGRGELDAPRKKGNVGADIGWRWTEVGRLVAGAGEGGGDVYDGVGIDERLGDGYCVAGTVCGVSAWEQDGRLTLRASRVCSLSW